MSRPSRQAGFTLVEILVVVVILGLVSSIALYNLLHALDRSRQRATMGDMRAIGHAVETYCIDNGLPPAAADMTALRAQLVPYQASAIPVVDHWGHLYLYQEDGTGLYTIQSLGKDGLDGPDLSYDTRHDVTRDIVLQNGLFTASPE